MRGDSFSTTTQQSWGSRLMQSLGGVLVGGALGIGAVVLLFWNEGRAVDRADTLALGAERVIDITADHIDASHEGALVHVGGITTVNGSLRDPLFGIEQAAVRLRRQVEISEQITLRLNAFPFTLGIQDSLRRQQA